MRNALTYLTVLTAIGCVWMSCQKSQAADAVAPKKDADGKAYFDDKEEFAKWSQTNVEFTQSKTLGDFTYKLTMLSQDQMAMQELRGNIGDSAKFAEAKTHYEDLIYYKLNISNDKHQGELLRYGLERNGEYTERIKYCSFHLNEDIVMVMGKDTVPCALHEFERTFNLQNGLNFLVTFPKVDFKNGATVAFQDNLFKNGIIKFFFQKSINELPYFKIK
ncbi:MAG TPA: hypothetical protein VD905_20140 [Flavobacteriales bacterium]|nr:hypothetical protein [Flavobacteriales bacterium]